MYKGVYLVRTRVCTLYVQGYAPCTYKGVCPYKGVYLVRTGVCTLYVQGCVPCTYRGHVLLIVLRISLQGTKIYMDKGDLGIRVT